MAHPVPNALEGGATPWYPPALMASDTPGNELPPRLRRTLELVYNVEGVVEARIWQWPGRVAVGVRGRTTTSPTELVRRVEVAVAGLREPEENWDFGILEESASGAE